MTRPPSDERPMDTGSADVTNPANDHDLTAPEGIEVITAELTRGVRPAPATLRAWVIATASVERTSLVVQSVQPEADRWGPRPLELTSIQAAIIPKRDEEDTMSDRTPVDTRSATLPGVTGSAVGHYTARSNRPSGATRRWNRLGWPIVELIGAAALIVGLVSVMMGGSGGGGLPALIPGFGQTTEQAATPAVANEPGEVAMAQGNAGRSGEMPGPGVLSDPALLWRTDLGYPSSAISTQVVSAGGTIYAAVTNASPSGSDQTPVNGLRAVDGAEGSMRWDVATNAQAISAPVIAQGLVIVGIGTNGQPLELDGSVAPSTTDESSAGYIVAFDVLSGQERWRANVGRIDTQDLTVADGLIYVGDQTGTIHALNVLTGSSIWTTFIPPVGGGGQDRGAAFSPVAVSDGTAVLLSMVGALYAYDSATGAFKWTVQVTDGRSYFPFQTGDGPVITGDTVLVPSFDIENGPDRNLAAFSLSDGNSLWQISTGLTRLSGLAVTGETVYLAGHGNGGGGLVSSIDVASGEMERIFATQRPLTTAPAIVDGTLYVGGEDWQLFAFTTADSGLRWSVAPLGEITSSAYVADGLVLFSASDGYLYAVSGNQAPADLLNTQDPVYISGPAQCEVPPRAQRLDSDETPVPAQTPVPDLAPVNPDRPFDPPAVRLADVPMGTAASPEAIAGIQSTMDRLATCSGPNDTLERDGLYSPSFFRRTGLSSASQLSDGISGIWALGGRPVVVNASNTATLPDGRTALTVMNPTAGEGSGYGTLYILIDRNGVWLVDEQVLITPSGNSGIG